ncbi:MAG TPA: hypothetical protein ENK26_05335 [Gammaproteobacteria bacterium]|nr:hypothetical protein [Gammaproteobacteria bacterium]
MSDLPPCPQCNSEYTYEDGILLVCPECGHEWSPSETPAWRLLTPCGSATPSPTRT